jgi:ribonucleoside-diphosphate reductase alpha chain
MKTKKIKIKDLKIGDNIKTMDNGKIVYKPVTNVWDTIVPKSDQVKLLFASGAIVDCSINHPIMVFEDGYIIEKLPNDLSEKDLVVMDVNAMVFDKLIAIKPSNNDDNYIDITVEDTHTFFTAESLDTPMILTHNSQGGIRGGSATCHLVAWHLEIEDLLVLKNNKGTDDNRVRRIDYSIQFNGYLLNRFINGEKITLFSPSDVPDLYDAFFQDQVLFGDLYEKYEKDKSIRKRKIDSKELISSFLLERFETGRIYFMFVDHSNSHSAFLQDVAPIRMSNLCQEVTLPTKPLTHLGDLSGEIALCILSSINVGNIKQLSDMEEPIDIMVRALDELISNQEYPIKAAEISTKNRRSLGIGIINYAYFLAKNNTKYDASAFELTNNLAESLQYYALKSSMNLARENGACKWFDQTKYSHGILPLDTYKKDIDDLITTELLYDWECLRSDILKYGLRNSTLTALMPSETSSIISNATNGIEPIRSLVTSKGSKANITKQVAPDSIKLKNKYHFAFDDINFNDGYIKIMGIFQKYFDQSISSNNYQNPNHYADNKIPLNVLIKDFLNAYKYGHKTGYYQLTLDNKGDDDNGCDSGACAI